MQRVQELMTKQKTYEGFFHQLCKTPKNLRKKHQKLPESSIVFELWNVNCSRIIIYVRLKIEHYD